MIAIETLQKELMQLRETCKELDIEKTEAQRLYIEEAKKNELLDIQIRAKEKINKALKMDIKRIEDISRDIIKDLESQKIQPDLTLLQKIKRLFK